MQAAPRKVSASPSFGSSSSSTARRRHQHHQHHPPGPEMDEEARERRPFLDGDGSVDGDAAGSPPPPAPSGAPGRWNQWIPLAVASGACAAFNGVFAKLTTTELTSNFSNGIASALGLSSIESIVEYVVRAIFFGLNLIFNGVMWSLFTAALARGHSTTQVSIMNTSANFVITAVLGFAIFSESLPPLWWLGAALLVAGNVVIGQKDESEKPGSTDGGDSGNGGDGDEDDIVGDDNGSYPLGRPSSPSTATPRAPERKKPGEEDEDILDLGDVVSR